MRSFNLVKMSLLALIFIVFLIPGAAALNNSYTVPATPGASCWAAQTGSFFDSTYYISLTRPETGVYTGLVFQGINISQGDLINNATLSLYFDISFDSGGSLATIYGYDEALGAAFYTYSGQLISSPLTSNSLTVNLTDYAAPGWRSYDVTSIVQEVINRPYWNISDNFGFIILGAPDQVHRTITSNVAYPSQWAELNLTWQEFSSQTGADPVEQYRGYTIYENFNGTYAGTKYTVELGSATWRVSAAINQHWLISTDNDVMILVYDDGGDLFSYYISDWGDLTDWDDPSEHGESFYTGAFAEKAGLSAWYSGYEDQIWLSGGYQSVGNNYQRHTNVTIDATLGYTQLWDAQIGAHGGNTQRSTSVIETPSRYRVVGYGTGSTSQYKYYTSPGDAVYTQHGEGLAVDTSAEVIVSYFGGLQPYIGLYMAFEDELDDYDLRWRAVNMTDNSAASGITYMGYINRYCYGVTPGALQDDKCYIIYYNTSSSWLECWEVNASGSYTIYQIDELSPTGSLYVTPILDQDVNETRIVAYVYDDNNVITAYNFYNGTWDSTPKAVASIGYDVTSLMGTPMGNVNVSGLLAEHSTGLIYIDVSEAFTGGFGGYRVLYNGTEVDTPCLSAAETLEEVEACIDTLLGGSDPLDPDPPGWDPDPNDYLTRPKTTFYFMVLGLLFIIVPPGYMLYSKKLEVLPIALFMILVGVALLWSMSGI